MDDTSHSIGATGLTATAQAAAALAAAMGIGRFVYTPILPLMHAQAHASHSVTAWLATDNYLGYFIGAAMLSVRPRWAHAQWLFRAALVTLLISEIGMAHVSLALWTVMRLVAGLASATVFISAATAVTSNGSLGKGYAGVGLGIALSGAMVVTLAQLVTWGGLWLSSAAMAFPLTVLAWRLDLRTFPCRKRGSGHSTGPVSNSLLSQGPVNPSPTPAPRYHAMRVPQRDWTLLWCSYFLEGVGYIILGTFLVAAVSEGSRWASGPIAWIVVGVGAAMSPAFCLWAERRCTAQHLIVLALLLQILSAAVPVLIGGAVATISSSLLFGITFIAIVMLSMESGVAMDMPHAAAVLTAGYAFGQILGPVVVAPFLSAGYRTPFLAAAAILTVATILAAPIRSKT